MIDPELLAEYDRRSRRIAERLKLEKAARRGATQRVEEVESELAALRDEVARLRGIERLADAASLAYGRSDGRIIPEMQRLGAALTDPSEPTEEAE